jgi:hypothetical protein
VSMPSRLAPVSRGYLLSMRPNAKHVQHTAALTPQPSDALARACPPCSRTQATRTGVTWQRLGVSSTRQPMGGKGGQSQSDRSPPRQHPESVHTLTTPVLTRTLSRC